MPGEFRPIGKTELLVRLAEGHAMGITVVTPNRRLAQALKSEFDAFQSDTNPPYRVSRGRLRCTTRKHQASVTAGAIFDKTRTPLKVWLAAGYITNQKQGVSALGLQRELGLNSYQTAWTMLHRFRRAMVRPGRDRLQGLVEVDETYIAIGGLSILYHGIHAI